MRKWNKFAIRPRILDEPLLNEYAMRTAVNARIRLKNQAILMTTLELDEVNGGFIEEVSVTGSS